MFRNKTENIINVDVEQNKNIINQLKPRRFDYIAWKYPYQNYGLIVDEVEEIYPEMIKGETIDHDKLIIMLLVEVKRMQEILDKLV